MPFFCTQIDICQKPTHTCRKWYIDAKLLGIAVFVKQMGTALSKELKMSDRHGGDIHEFPESLQIREFPDL